MASQTESDHGNDLNTTYLFHQLDSYPWDEDQEFQGGLKAILGSVQDPEQVEQLTLRAKCYYYARIAGTPVEFDAYKTWIENNGRDNEGRVSTSNGAPETLSSQPEKTAEEASGDGGMANAPKPASFAEICDMIAEGKPIPGIKDIPDTILEGRASDSHVQKREKPWEKRTGADGLETTRPSWMT